MGHIDRALDRAAQRAKKARQELPPAADVVEPSAERFDIDAVRRVEVDSSELKKNRLVTDDKAPSNAAYRMLRTRLLQRMRTNGWTTLAVTGMSPGEGALSQLRAATDPGAKGGELYGPLFVNSGPPVRKPVLRRLGMQRAVDRLWHVSERETGLKLRP